MHGSRATPLDVDALAKTKGSKKGGKGKNEGNCFWCGAYGHLMEDCQKKAAGNEDLIRNRRAKAKEAKARRERRPLTSGQTVRRIHRLMRSHRGGCRSLRWCQPTREVQSTRRIQKQARDQWTSYKSGNLCANAVDAELGGRIGLSIGSRCAACALPVGVASAVGMQELNRTPQEYIAAKR